jgi:hypothetical protein
MKPTFKGLVIAGLLLLMGITSVGAVLAANLTDDEVYWLTYMREEEKLARDVGIRPASSLSLLVRKGNHSSLTLSQG